MMFWSGKSIFLIVLVKKEYLKPGSIEGSHYYDNVRVRETQVTNPFFTKRNIGFVFCGGKSIFTIVLVKKEYLKPGSFEGSH